MMLWKDSIPIMILYLTIAIFCAPFIRTRQMYFGYLLFRITPINESQLQYLLTVNSNSSVGIDFWLRTTAVNHSADVMVSPGAKTSFLQNLKERNITLKFLIQDLGRVIEDDLNAPTIGFLSRGPMAFFAQYNRFDKILNYLSVLSSNYPDFVSTLEIGKSFEDRPILVFKISTSNKPNKQIIFIQGGAHAREHIGPAVLTYIALQLVTKYQQEADVTEIVDAFDWYILPVANPDGYEYSFTKDRLWRKTRSFNPESSQCFGVDSNRNWDFHWNGAEGSSSDPCSHNYAGPKAFSEPETDAVSRFMLTHLKGRLLLFLDFHSYSQRWLTPWGYTTQLPPNYEAQKQLAECATRALEEVYGTKYSVGSSAGILYTVSGGARDWVYGKVGAEYSYVVELRDKGNYGFLLPKAQILPSSVETMIGLKAMVTELTRRQVVRKEDHSDTIPTGIAMLWRF